MKYTIRYNTNDKPNLDKEFSVDAKEIKKVSEMAEHQLKILMSCRGIPYSKIYNIQITDSKGRILSELEDIIRPEDKEYNLPRYLNPQVMRQNIK